MPATHSHFASPFVYYLDLHLFPTRRSSDLHGRPLIAGTTTVSGPTRVFSRGSIAAIECVFKQMKTASWTRSSAGSDDAGSEWTSGLPAEIKVSPRLRIASR